MLKSFVPGKPAGCVRLRRKLFTPVTSFGAFLTERSFCGAAAVFRVAAELRPSGVELSELELDTEAKIARQMTSTAPIVKTFDEVRVVIMLILSPAVSPWAYFCRMTVNVAPSLVLPRSRLFPEERKLACGAALETAVVLL